MTILETLARQRFVLRGIAENLQQLQQVQRTTIQALDTIMAEYTDKPSEVQKEIIPELDGDVGQV